MTSIEKDGGERKEKHPITLAAHGPTLHTGKYRSTSTVTLEDARKSPNPSVSAAVKRGVRRPPHSVLPWLRSEALRAVSLLETDSR